MLEALLRRALPLLVVNRLGNDHAHADHRVRDRDEPHPAQVGTGEHAYVSLPAAFRPRDPLELRVHRDVAQQRILGVAADLLRDDPGSAGGIHHHGRAQAARAARVGRGQGHPVPSELHVRDPAAFSDHGPAGSRVLEQEMVELGAGHLEGLGSRGLGRLGKVSVLLGAAVRREEARAPLADEAGGRDFFLHPESSEDLVAPGQLRFADVEAREGGLLEHDHGAPLSSEHGGRT